MIENMASSSLNKNQETDRSQKVNSVVMQKINDLTAKVEIKSNNSHVFIMEEAAHEQSTADAVHETDNPTDDHHEVIYVNGLGWKFKNYHPNPHVRNNPQLFNTSTTPTLTITRIMHREVEGRRRAFRRVTKEGHMFSVMRRITSSKTRNNITARKLLLPL